ncbi:MAG: hypothetical protein CMF96_01365 [Candidatus Marinimicrobia bacterium]|nr:hypothetical protein [Candidatus Neomarinimicrobiota bacterium]|tara:strand:+ start:2644 stop:3153 length:510 start_codon:yes stop_codon:yes gene_type:complete
MQSYILTAFGADKPGLVSTLSGLIENNGGNIEESKMVKMGNQFVMIILISLSNLEAMNLKLNLNKNINLQAQIIQTKKLDNEKISHFKKLKLSGADNEGIVHSLTKKLATYNINIIELETFIDLAPISATPLFNLNALIKLPKNLDENQLIDILDKHSKKLGIDIRLVN